MNSWLVLAFISAGLELLAVWKNSPRLEYVAKPAVMVFLFIWLYVRTGLQGNSLWFGAGILFSLAGDVLLMFPSDGAFRSGLVAFLLAHASYIVGWREGLLNITVPSLMVLFVIFISGLRLSRNIIQAMRIRGQTSLIPPVVVYGLVISLMLYAAMSTIFDRAWSTRAAFLVSVGAFLFYISDLILGWNKFVSPLKNGSILNMSAYHLGQICLVAGVVSQFA